MVIIISIIQLPLSNTSTILLFRRSMVSWQTVKIIIPSPNTHNFQSTYGQHQERNMWQLFPFLFQMNLHPFTFPNWKTQSIAWHLRLAASNFCPSVPPKSDLLPIGSELNQVRWFDLLISCESQQNARTVNRKKSIAKLLTTDFYYITAEKRRTEQKRKNKIDCVNLFLLLQPIGYFSIFFWHSVGRKPNSKLF